MAPEAMHPTVRSILDRARERPPPSGRVAVEARPLDDALRASGGRGLVPVVAELKRSSPTATAVHDVDPVETARAMVDAGAAAVSVVTEPTAFGGSPADLRAIRRAVDVPVLRKDFVLEPAELDRVAADAVLLVARFVDDLPGLVAAARERGMAPLVEAHTRAEVDDALAAGAHLVGINNRDLARLAVSLSTVERLAPAVPEGTAVVAESGIATCDDAARMLAAGADGLLVGTAVMDGDVADNVARFVGCRR